MTVRYTLSSIPEELRDLSEVALDLLWSWNHSADHLWKQVAPELWERTGNPWLILQSVPVARLHALKKDTAFKNILGSYLESYREAMKKPGWFRQAYPETPLTVAYFSMEFGLTEALPIYSGGLGVLAGDYLKTVSDLDVPAVGVGLLYQQGYFRQELDEQGHQLEFYPYNDPGQLPILPVSENGDRLRVIIELPGRQLTLRCWEAKIGRTKLYLLDSNDPVNSPPDRGITSELYGGGTELRLQQEIVLGIGGWRLLQALGIDVKICHLNEGHAALVVLERARAFRDASGQPFGIALTATRVGNIFTTHTPVEAGFDRFSPDLVRRYLESYAEQLGISLDRLLALGRADPGNAQEGPFNMAYLALRGSGTVNAVSRLHAEVSRDIFQPLFPRIPRWEVPVTHVTNGVHVPSWDSAAADEIWTSACGKGRWLGTMDTIEKDLKKVPDEELWNFRKAGRQQLINYTHERLAWQLASLGASAEEVNRARQLLNPDILTIGFARRFTAYKRPNLLLHDPDRLVRLLTDNRRPVQLIIAGKAHPRDEEGKAMIQDWHEFIARPEVRPHAVFLADYDMSLAEQLVQGVDLWINTPRRPWEACGTSGMKVLVNGGLNLSERDGWWAEAYAPEVGWAIGDGREHGDDSDRDAKEAEELNLLLENDVVPCFYNRDDRGVPRGWIARMRASMAELTPRFSTNRMLREYVEKLYLPALQNYERRVAYRARQAVLLSQWYESIQSCWSHLKFGRLEIERNNTDLIVTVIVYFGRVDSEWVQVQLYAEPEDDGKPEIYLMERGEAVAGAEKGYVYTARFPSHRPPGDYTPRIIPCFRVAMIPLEAANIIWYER